MTLIVGMGSATSIEQVEQLIEKLAAMGIDAVIISHCTALAVIPDPPRRRRWWQS